MNTTSRTMIFAAVAAVSVIAAVATHYANRPNTVDGFAEVGQPFFADFTEPQKAAALAVAVFDKDVNEPVSFAVKQNDNGLWVIPSHHNYPAEAADRLARTATSFISLKRAAVQSRSRDDWEDYGVVDPTDTGLAGAEARGTRVTLSDGSGNPLVDLIVGKPVPERDKTYYVREPEKNTTYLAELDVDLSAKFSDWIEPDLLKVTQNDLVRMIRDNYSVDEVKGLIVKGDVITFEKQDLKTTGTWTLAGLDDATEEIVTSPISALARNLDQLKIVGIRPKPQGLNADLTVSPEVARNPLVRQILEADMQKQGFYIAAGPDGKELLVSNEGELIAGTGDGIEYTLYFGEIARGSARDVEVGFASEEAAKDAEPSGDASGDEAADPADSESTDPADDSPEGPRRYLLVKVRFDESLLGPKPQEPVEPVMPEILNEPAPPTDAKPPADPAAAGDAPTTSDPAPPVSDDNSGEQQSQDAPATDAPATDAPATDAPAADNPAADNPAADNPAADAPAADAPAADAPSTDVPSADDNACFIDEQPPAGDAPAQDSPETDPPATDPPATDPPATDPPAQEPAGDAPTDPQPPATGQESPQEPAPADTPKPAETPSPAADETPAPDPAAAVPAQDTTPAPPVIPQESTQPPIDPRQLAQEAYDQAKGEYEAAKRAYDADLADWTRRETEGRRKADELALRFAEWYYVITAESFDKFKVARTDVVKKKESEPDAGTPEAVQP